MQPCTFRFRRFLALAMLVLAVAGPATAADKAGRLLAKAEKALESGRLEDAEEGFLRADEAAGGDWFPALSGLARARLSRFDHVGAFRAAREALAAARGEAETSSAHNLAGRALLRGYHTAEAHRALQQRSAAAGSSARAELRAEAARMLSGAGAELRLALESDRQASPDALAGRAHALWHAGFGDEARQALDRYLQAVAPSEPSAEAAWLGECIDAVGSPPAEGPWSSAGFESGRKVSGENPRLPETAGIARVEGVVVVGAVHHSSGVLHCLEVLKGLPLGIDEAVLAAMRTWRFEPARLDGEPLSYQGWLTTTIEFH